MEKIIITGTEEDDNGIWKDGVYTPEPLKFADGAELQISLDFSDIVEKLGEIIDTCDSFSTFENNGFMTPHQKVEALAHGLEDVRASLLELYLSFDGEDHWEGRE